MQGITIRDIDERGLLAVDLKKILGMLGERAIRSRWILSGVEAGGEQAATDMHSLSDNRTPIGGSYLLHLACGVWQVITGTFEAIEDEEHAPWITICAVDSTAFDVFTSDSEILDRLRSAFRNVMDLPPSAL